jgi:F-type H+-transporting ATPase subunit gamma
MKMIASTKLSKAQRAMQAGKKYGQANAGKRSFTFSTTTSLIFVPEVFAHSPADTPTPRKLFIVVSSDKGLCGGIHSSVTKATRRALGNAPDSPFASASNNGETTTSQIDPESPIMVIGDKSKAQLTRAAPHNLRLTFNQIGRDVPTFADAAGVADLIAQSGVKYDSVVLVYNRFVSAISYEPAIMEVKGEEGLRESSKCRDLFSCWLMFMRMCRRVQGLRK